jgi:protein-S-isoprenylcysteine O-methyltransferase Ste14
MYVGGMTVLAGMALIFALDWLVLLMVPAAFVLHHGIVSREEQYLLRKFGDEYRNYRAKAPRYLPLIS